MSVETVTVANKGFAAKLAEAKLSRLWLLSLALYAFIAVWFLVSDRLSFNFESLSRMWAVAGLLAVWEAFSRVQKTGSFAPLNSGSPRLMFAHAIFTVPALGILNHLTMSLGMPLADNLLSGWDEALGFNWAAYANFIGDNDFLRNYTQFTYSLLIIAVLLVALDKGLSKQYARCQEVFALHMGTAFTAILFACFFPSRGTMDRYSDAAIRAKFDPETGTAYIKQLVELRSGEHVTIDPLHMMGLAEFPSFHTAAAILIVYACRGNFVRLAVGSTFAIGMIGGTPIYGAHYFVDLISGTCLALVAIGVSRLFKPALVSHK